MILNLSKEGEHMDNIRIEKNWEDSNILEIKVSAQSEYISIYQLCYIESADLEVIGNRIKEFSFNFNDNCYVEFGKMIGDFTPAFSLNFFPADAAGKIKIEVDMEIDDNEERKHRCCFYIHSEIGLIEQFGNRLVLMSTQYSVDEISLNA